MKLYQKYLLALLVALLISITFFYTKNEEQFLKRVDSVLINLLNKQINQEKAEAFAFALALAQNESLQDAIIDDDNEKAFHIMQQYMMTLESFSGTKVRTQIITDDLVIFARSWDKLSLGLPIEQYRPDLEQIQKSRQPRVSFEAARRLVMIATIPIIREDKLIGFIEVIKLFNGLKKFFKPYEVDLIVLLDEKYENQSILLRDYPRIDDMIVASESCNSHYVQYLKKTGITALKNHGYIQGEEHVYFSKVMKNGDGVSIGMLVLALSKEKLSVFNAFEKELQTLFSYARKDLYYSVKENVAKKGIYHNLIDKELLQLKESIHEEDKQEVFMELQERLHHYTKEELISLLLEQNTHTQIKGSIE